jgi:hypothetical protein
MTTPFDPSRFRAKESPLPPDPLVEAIPTDGSPRQLRMPEARTLERFVLVPMAGWELFPPQARVLFLLQRLSGMFPPDGEGGWYRLSKSRLADAGLGDRFQRRRALEQLERAGTIELGHGNGKQTKLARLAPAAADLLRWEKREVRRPDRRAARTGRKMRVTDIETGAVVELDINSAPQVAARG